MHQLHLLHPLYETKWYLAIAASLIGSVVLVLLLMTVPPRYRKHLILTATFIGGLLFALEFFLPVKHTPTLANPDQVGNFLTPYVVPFGNVSTVIFAWTVGLGIYNLCQVHGRRLVRGGNLGFNSFIFFISMIGMCVMGLLQNAHPNPINKNLYGLLFDGALQSLDATMFSIIAFYIASAAYRAFRVRSVEASLLLVTAVVVMLGQIAVGQWITHWRWLPPSLHIEVIRDWILTKANAPATRAVGFGLGIGGLAVALRIWLGLERGSYFEGE